MFGLGRSILKTSFAALQVSVVPPVKRGALTSDTSGKQLGMIATLNFAI